MGLCTNNPGLDLLFRRRTGPKVDRRADRDTVCFGPHSANDDRAARHGPAKGGELLE